MIGRANPLLTYLFAGLILAFTGGPVLLSLVGSVVPDRIIVSIATRACSRKGQASRPIDTFSRASYPPPICRRTPTAQ